VYCLRVNLSVALVAMVNQTFASGAGSSNGTSDECLSDITGNSTSEKKSDGEMNWDSHKQALVLASFFYGYIVTQVCLSFVACIVT
jgi:MFS transporter, ACS family, solute carrier family 17 (sodium-dependent inorganic phosphate cotransporter), member 5